MDALFQKQLFDNKLLSLGERTQKDPFGNEVCMSCNNLMLLNILANPCNTSDKGSTAGGRWRQRKVTTLIIECCGSDTNDLLSETTFDANGYGKK